MLDTVKAKPSVAAKERPALTASPRDGRTDMRSGRKKASGGIEQKKGWRLFLGAGLAGASTTATIVLVESVADRNGKLRQANFMPEIRDQDT